MLRMHLLSFSNLHLMDFFSFSVPFSWVDWMVPLSWLTMKILQISDIKFHSWLWYLQYLKKKTKGKDCVLTVNLYNNNIDRVELSRRKLKISKQNFWLMIVIWNQIWLTLLLIDLFSVFFFNFFYYVNIFVKIAFILIFIECLITSKKVILSISIEHSSINCCPFYRQNFFNNKIINAIILCRRMMCCSI